MNRYALAMDRTALLREAEDALTNLSPHEELYLRLRFGIGGKQESADVIARRFRLEPAHLRDLEARVLNRLRKLAIKAELRRPVHGES